MRTSGAHAGDGGLTLIELLCVVAIIAILLLLLLPTGGRGHKRPRLAMCMSNQKQILLGEQLWRGDHDNQFRWQVFTSNPTNLIATANVTADYFQPLNSEYVRNARLFFCSTEKTRKPSADGVLRSTNISYFICFTAGSTNPASSILIGDRHLAADQQPLPTGMNHVTAKQLVSWTAELHANSGVLGFVDGHSELKKTTTVSVVFQRQNVATNLLAIP